jgi:hypothetical protein
MRRSNAWRVCRATSSVSVRIRYWPASALRIIDAIARRESLVLAYNDCFYFMGTAFVTGVILTYCLKSYRAPTASAK